MSIAALMLLMCSCVGGGNSTLKLIQQAHDALSEATPLREDLEGLLKKLEGLGTRFKEAEDTLKEGKSLVNLAKEDVLALRETYLRADEALARAEEEGRGDYARYAQLLREALGLRLEVLDLQEEYLRIVSDFLDVLPYAEERSQLQYYLESMERVSREMAEKSERSALAAEKADSFRREHGL